MLDKAKLVNILLFMERVNVIGKEAFAWAETYQAVGAEATRLSAPLKPLVAQEIPGGEGTASA